MAEARVMIVEDDVIVAEDLRRSLEAAGYDVVGHAMDKRTAVNMARHLHPDVILMDVYLTGTRDGIEAARAIQQSVDTSIVYVSAHSDDSLVREAVRTGAFGYVIKPFQPRQIMSTIEIAMRWRHDQRSGGRRTALPFTAFNSHPNVRATSEARADHATARTHHAVTLRGAQRLVVDNAIGPGAGARLAGAAHESHVTPRETEVVRGLLRYRRLNAVASELGISVNTARKHLKSVFRKLNVHSQDELFRLLLDDREAG